jgi:hypothetical protein
MQMMRIESTIDCLCTSFGRIRSRRSSRVVGKHLVNHGDDRNLWSSLHGDFKMSLFKRNFENELNFPFKTLWCRNLSLQCGVLVNFEKNHFFPFSNEQKIVPLNRSFGRSWHSIAEPFTFIKKDQGHRIQVNNLAFLLWTLWDWILKGNQRMCMIVLEELRVFTE